MSQAGQFVINFEASPNGAIKQEGNILTVQYPGAKFIFGGIWRQGENGPTIIFGQSGDTGKMVLKRSSFSIKGPTILKVRAYLQDWTNQYIEAPFTIT